ncbi:MAG: 2,3-bisphosphoglycerate-independent phosphoglycerate mutase, partial [Pseudomonadota bacterium]
AYCDAIDAAKTAGGAVHIMGLLSPGGVHSHERHLFAAIRLAASRGVERVYLHAFLDGRDTPPRSAQPSLQAAQSLFDELGCGRVASICGRYYAMDRDNNWDRVSSAYALLTEGISEHTAQTAVQGLEAAYERDENDEFVLPTAIVPEGQSVATIDDGDSVIFMNFRADRARELTRAFVDSHFSQFERSKQPTLSAFVTTTEYAADLDAPCAFGPESLQNVLGDYLAQMGMTQLRIAETEKYAHVTFFFSGGREEPFPGEDRELIKSPAVATYDLQPAMSAPEVTDKLVAAIESGHYDLIVCNYANGDMVGHTGVFEAAVEAVETVDACLGRIEEAVLAAGGEALITADHGNCEQMLDYETGQRHTQHTTEKVPLIYIGKRSVAMDPKSGRLADIAPTVLTLMGIDKPAEMTGDSLVQVPIVSD